MVVLVLWRLLASHDYRAPVTVVVVVVVQQHDVAPFWVVVLVLWHLLTSQFPLLESEQFH